MSLRAGILIVLLASAGSAGEIDSAAPEVPEEPAPEPADEPSDEGEFSWDITQDGGIEDGDDGDTEADGGASTGAGGTGTTGTGGSNRPSSTLPPRIACNWNPSPTSDELVDLYNQVYDIIDDVVDETTGVNSVTFETTFYIHNGTLHRWNSTAGRFEQYQRAACTGATRLTATEIRGWRWVTVTPPTADILIPDLTLIVTGRLPLPASAINPPTRAPINLGLWLAIANPDDIVATGRLGPLWATGTASLTATTFDPGNGDPPISCPGGGTPILHPDTVEEGPCGYTYRTLDDARNDDLAITATTAWTITWQTSDGSGDDSPPEIRTRTNTYPYDVYEIQTVGN